MEHSRPRHIHSSKMRLEFLSEWNKVCSYLPLNLEIFPRIHNPHPPFYSPPAKNELRTTENTGSRSLGLVSHRLLFPVSFLLQALLWWCYWFLGLGKRTSRKATQATAAYTSIQLQSRPDQSFLKYPTYTTVQKRKRQGHWISWILQCFPSVSDLHLSQTSRLFSQS